MTLTTTFMLTNNTTGEVGDFWERYEAPLNVAGSFQVVIEGTRGSNIYSDMAIDDVAFSSGCLQSDGNRLVTATGSVTTPTTPAVPCGAGRFQ